MKDSPNRILRAIVIGIWLVVIFPLSISLSQVIAGLPSKDFLNRLRNIALGAALLSPLGLAITSGILITLIYFTIITSTFRLHPTNRKRRLLKKYSRIIVRRCQNSEPIGDDNRSEANDYSKLISVSVPLNDIFIRLHAVFGYPPRSEMPPEQQETEEGLIQGRPTQSVNIEEVLQRLTAEHPGAVILGDPGSGKSTTMRWLTYQMAYASHLSWYHPLIHSTSRFLRFISSGQLDKEYEFPTSLAPRQIPILFKIEDYVKDYETKLKTNPTQQLDFQDFFIEYFKNDKGFKKLPKLADTLLYELQKGRCLLLFDGLDEVVSDTLREDVSSSIAAFIEDNTSESNAHYYNRFIVTSRLVGYKRGELYEYAHYTLQKFEDSQIKQFLNNWFSQAILSRGGRWGKKLSSQERVERDKKRDKLLESIKRNPSVELLADNPLTLTILALLQLDNETLSVRRIVLYQLVSNKFITARRVLNNNKIKLVEKILSRLAYELHNTDRTFTEVEVKSLASSIMHDFYEKAVSDSNVEQFDEIARSISGLFIEKGLNQFEFMHRTFREYFAALYLSDMPSDKLKAFIRKNCHASTWHEPLLFLFAYLSESETNGRIELVNDLLRIIINDTDRYEIVLHRNLLLTARILAECDNRNIDSKLQKRIATDLFYIYGDVYDSERYTEVVKDIEKIALLWLRSQNNTNTLLLETWHNTLCDEAYPVHQEGAVHLLVSIASGLSDSRTVVSKLLPPLIKLARLEHFPYYPTKISEQLFTSRAQPSSLKVTHYALVALRLFDEQSLPGWLHKVWFQLNEERPRLLRRLTEHSLSLGYLLTPTAFPSKSDSLNWKEQIAIIDKWQEVEQSSSQDLQLNLLSSSTASSYPFASILKEVLEKEFSSSSVPLDRWREVWNTFLQEKMMRAESDNYQACLYLRILICKEAIKKDEEYKQRHKIAKEIAEELIDAITIQGNIQKEHALTAIANVFWHKVRAERYLQAFQEPWLRELEDLLLLRDLLDIYNLYLGYLHDLRKRRNLRYLREQTYLAKLKEALTLDAYVIREMWNLRNIQSIFFDIDISNELDTKKIVTSLCDLLEQCLVDENYYTILIIIYTIILTDNSISHLYTHIKDSIYIFKDWARSSLLLTREHLSLIINISQLIQANEELQLAQTGSHVEDNPDDLVSYIYQLRQDEPLTKQQVEKILLACLDTRRLSIGSQRKLHLDTVQAGAWEILKQPFVISSEAFSFMLTSMDGDNAIICAAIARLAQHSKTLTIEKRQEMAEKVMKTMKHGISRFYPIHQLDYRELWRLDDVLYESLTALIL